MQSKLWVLVLLGLILIPASAEMLVYDGVRKTDFKSLPIATTLSVAFGYCIGVAFSHFKTSPADNLISSDHCPAVLPYDDAETSEQFDSAILVRIPPIANRSWLTSVKVPI